MPLRAIFFCDLYNTTFRTYLELNHLFFFSIDGSVSISLFYMGTNIMILAKVSLLELKIM